MRWTADRANSWYQAQGWLVGANYITSNAINQLEMFQPGTYDPRRIDGELARGRLIGFNTVRVFLHDQLWAQDRQGFSRRLAQFVAIAASHGIKPLFVLFDSCWDPHPAAGPSARADGPGCTTPAGCRAPAPSTSTTADYTQRPHDYVTGVLSLFRNDHRVLGWDLWNEPDNPAQVYRKVERQDKLELVAALLPQVFQWARAVNPVQPLTSGVWQGNWGTRRRSAIGGIQLDNSDVITFHSLWQAGGVRGPDRRTRPAGASDPVHRVPGAARWAARRGHPADCQAAQRRCVQLGPGGRQDSDVSAVGFLGSPVPGYPKAWFSDLLRPDGRPYRDSEIQTIQTLTSGPAALPAAAR